MNKLWIICLCLALPACVSTYTGAVSPNPWVEISDSSVEVGAFQPAERPSLLYITDRNTTPAGEYGTSRSSSMAFGRIGIEVSNMTLPAYSAYMSGQEQSRARPRYQAAGIEELIRFPGTPLPFSIENNAFTRDRSAVGAYLRAGAGFRTALADEIRARQSGQVVLFVHGFNNGFEDGAYNLFELWAASGWSGVPVLFSWPTGEPNLLSYFGDTQNGEFSIFHFKETLRLISSTEGVEEIVVIAHSRGASIATTALRELLIESRGAGLSMRNTYRINTLILAAPDIDLGVMEQRLVAEMFGIGFGQINVYINPDDNALGLAGLLFGSTRFGAARPDQLSSESRAVFRGVETVHFILVEDAGAGERHNYFRLHPGVLSDIGVTIRTGAQPADSERPLERLEFNFWRIDRNYTPAYSGG